MDRVIVGEEEEATADEEDSVRFRAIQGYETEEAGE